MTSSVVITGCLGGIGSKLVEAFHRESWNVIGIDRKGSGVSTGQYGHVIEADIADFSADSDALDALGKEVRACSEGRPLCALINNAAVQNLGPLGELTTPQIVESMHVNLIAPMLLAREFLPELRKNEGSIVNIGSVHAQATKPGFAAYATSKAALHGMTRALAVDLGPQINVNTLAPAATGTAMLLAGFEGQEGALADLEDVHPLKRIASPEEIAQLALFLTSQKARFVTGATFFADGGILSRLHDPV